MGIKIRSQTKRAKSMQRNKKKIEIKHPVMFCQEIMLIVDNERMWAV